MVWMEIRSCNAACIDPGFAKDGERLVAAAIPACDAGQSHRNAEPRKRVSRIRPVTAQRGAEIVHPNRLIEVQAVCGPDEDVVDNVTGAQDAAGADQLSLPPAIDSMSFL